jgi:hypothetical protein
MLERRWAMLDAARPSRLVGVERMPDWTCLAFVLPVAGQVPVEPERLLLCCRCLLRCDCDL